MGYVIALAGNQNAGKTTLFNLLTGEGARVGNWPGVTVERMSGLLRTRFLPEDMRGERVEIVDLPGVYSLTPFTPEEVIARDFIMRAKPDVVIDVADAAALSRSLYLTTQLLSLGRPVAVALNMMDEVAARGGTLDASALSRALGAPCVGISARAGTGVAELMRAALHLAKSGQAPMPLLPWRAEIGDIAAYADLARRRYALIDRAAAGALTWKTGADAPPGGLSGALERAFECRWAAGGMVLFALAAVFYLSFGPAGGGAARLCEGVMARALAAAGALMESAGTPPLARGLLLDGALRGVATVVGFLPPILLFFALLSLLEDTGLMARAAFLLDRPMRRIGLTGRSFIPLMTGFGCTVPAVMASRALPSRRERVITALLTPYIACGAKAPVYLYVTAAFFPGRPWAIFLLYLLGVGAAALAGWALKGRNGAENAPFLMELPPFRAPTLRGAGRQLKAKARDFLSRAFTVVFLCSVILWALSAFTPALRPAPARAQSLLYALGGAAAALMRPLGFGSPDAAAALIAGAFAKENIVSALSLAGGACFVLPSGAAALSFLTFAALYAPCAAALAALRAEAGGRRTLLSALAQSGVAWGAAFLVYRAALLLGL